MLSTESCDSNKGGRKVGEKKVDRGGGGGGLEENIRLSLAEEPRTW